jgi:hypothetical protein
VKLPHEPYKTIGVHPLTNVADTIVLLATEIAPTGLKRRPAQSSAPFRAKQA